MLLDTGPIVAMLHRDDDGHAGCVRAMAEFHGSLLTTEPVLTEAMYLLGTLPGGSDACLEFFMRGAAVLIPQSRATLTRVQSLMAQYRDVPMDFADATLVALAEETNLRRVFTLDRRGFSVYRLGRRGHFELEPR